jgi:hypothetical protein
VPTDFEQRLRAGLQARASHVTPNPETWSRVQEGIRREQRFRWVLAGAATAALVAVAVLVVPGLVTRSGVEFGPPDVADQPGATPTAEPRDDAVAPPAAGAAPPPVDVVVAASQDVGIIGPEVSRIVGSVPAAEHVAVHPASTADDLDVVVAGDCTLQRIAGDAAGSSVEAIPLAGEGACPAGPRFSPEGDHLAWIEGGGAGGFTLRTIGWDDGPQPVRDNAWQLDLSVLDELNVDALESLRIVEWSWTVPGSSEGVLVLAGRDADDGVNRTYFLPVELQGDGAVALPSGSVLEADPAAGDQRMLAVQWTEAAAWSLELLSIGEVEIVRSDDGERLGTLRLHADVLDAQVADAGPVWMEVVDEVVVVGDGRGRAWWTQWDGEAFGALTGIAPDLGIVHGAALGGGAEHPETSPPAGTETDATEEPAEESTEPHIDEGLPAPVADTRQALIDAAATGDLENLRPLLPDDGFSFSFGASEDPIAYWRRRQAEGEDILGLIQRLLELSHTEVGAGTQGPTMYVWPFAFDRPYESLSSAELVMLEEAIGPEGMASYEESGQYLHYRIGIEADGTWRYLIAGD